MIENADWERLARYLAGECTPSEAAEIERWISASPERRELVASLERQWTHAGLAREGVNVDRAWARLQRELPNAAQHVPDDGGDIFGRAPIETARRPWLARSAGLAAALVLVIGGALMMRGGFGSTSVASDTAVIAPAAEVRTSTGERRTMLLPDGSEVTLGVASRMKLDSAFGKTYRDVLLEGEALFRVTHDSAKAFRVWVGSAVAVDLGTEFVVRAYAETNEVRVGVTEGSVGLARRGGSPWEVTVLHPRDVGLLKDTARTATVMHEQDMSRLLAWTTGSLVFDNTPLSQVALELSRWYDVNVRVADPVLAGRLLTVTFAPQEQLDEVLRVIGLQFDVRVEREGRVITFRPNAGATIDIRRASPSAPTEVGG
jgi:ferric-dicitrate binding protein FerR (iron transport regulator)